MNRVLVTGGAGYIGSVMTGLLLDRGYDVTVLDRFFFGDTLAGYGDRVQKVRDDIRTCDASVFDGVDAVFDLAAISNDPAGDLDPTKTLAINHEGRARICRLAKDAGVERYVLASSCSIYGFQDDVVDETSPINPLTTYAEANGLAESSNLPQGDDGFSVTALRQSTVYGLSPRMRFDLVINGMTLAYWRDGKVKIMRDGNQWRPMVHVRDTARAFIEVMEADRDKVNGQIFNVGSPEQNLTVMEMAERIADALDLPFEMEWYGDPDHRSYKVSFDKIQDTLGYRTEYTPEDAAREIHEALEAGTVVPDERTRTLDWYKRLMAEQDPEVVMNGVVL